MGKVKIYDPKKEAEKEKAKERLIVIFEIVFDLVIYAVILMLASLIFKGLYIENFAYAFLASAIIAALNNFWNILSSGKCYSIKTLWIIFR